MGVSLLFLVIDGKYNHGKSPFPRLVMLMVALSCCLSHRRLCRAAADMGGDAMQVCRLILDLASCPNQIFRSPRMQHYPPL
jgi:hypothetical protein